jgi:RHS repeat-associated protein
MRTRLLKSLSKSREPTTPAGTTLFGRTLSQKWSRGTAVHSQTDYAYDHGGNRTTREVVGATGFDQAYAYDGLDRLKAMNQGTLTGGSITSSNLSQDWTLDQLGNWSEFEQGDGSIATLEQTRAHNEANEVGVIGATTGTNWVDPAHDAAGNMTTIPQPKNLAAGYSAKYDAWNRLVSLNDGSDDVQVNEYDGLHRRIVRDESAGSGNRRHFYYNENWQCVVEGVETSGTISGYAIYGYHAHYIDAVSARMRASDGHAYLHDANFNVVATMNLSPLAKNRLVERYHYSPYGEVTVLDADYSPEGEAGDSAPDDDGLSDFDNEFLYTGRRLDPETGLQYSRWRYLHVQLGRWTSRDPIGYADGYNLYEYVGGNPTGATDPLGWFEFDPGWLQESGCVEYCIAAGGDPVACEQFCGLPPNKPWPRRPPLVFPPTLPNGITAVGIPPRDGHVDVPDRWPHDIDWGEEVFYMPEPEPKPEGVDCRCSSSGRSLVRPPGGASRPGTPGGGVFIDVDLLCNPGDVIIKRYTGDCIGTDCCEGAKCEIYVQWTCRVSYTKKRGISTSWGSTKQVSTSCATN